MARSNTSRAKNAVLKAMICLPIIGCSTLAHSLAYQNFLGLNYSNPAELSNIKNYQLIVGGDEVFQDVRFRGSFKNSSGTVTNGTVNSNPNDYLPNGRFAFRVNDSFTLGVDVTQPEYTHFEYPKNSFIRNAAITTLVRATDISPRLAWKATENLAVGVGFNAQYGYEATLSNWVQRSATANFELRNEGNPNWAYGMNAGLFYTVKKGTYVGFSYYSKVTNRAKSGVSTYGPIVTERFNTTSLIMPATYSLNVTQYVSPTWLFNAIVRYNVWDPQKALFLNNTAVGNVKFTQNYFNAFRYVLSTKYEFNTRWAGLAGVEYSPTSQNTIDRGIGLPVTGGTVAALGAQMVISEGLTARILASRVFADPDVDLAYAGNQRATGNFKIRTSTVGFRITYEA